MGDSTRARLGLGGRGCGGQEAEETKGGVPGPCEEEEGASEAGERGEGDEEEGGDEGEGGERKGGESGQGEWFETDGEATDSSRQLL